MKSLAAVLSTAAVLLFPTLSNAWEIGNAYRTGGLFCKTKEAADSMPHAHKEKGLEAAREIGRDLMQQRACVPGTVNFVLREHIATYADLKFEDGTILTLHVFRVNAVTETPAPEYFLIVKDGFDKSK